MAFNFYDRNKGVGFRAVLRPDISDKIGGELHNLMKKVADGTANEEERVRCDELKKALQDRYMDVDLEEMFTMMEPAFPIPKPARILQSLRCETCGEMAMESRTRRFGGKTLCLPCFERMEQKT